MDRSGFDELSVLGLVFGLAHFLTCWLGVGLGLGLDAHFAIGLTAGWCGGEASTSDSHAHCEVHDTANSCQGVADFGSDSTKAASTASHSWRHGGAQTANFAYFVQNCCLSATYSARAEAVAHGWDSTDFRVVRGAYLVAFIADFGAAGVHFDLASNQASYLDD